MEISRYLEYNRMYKGPIKLVVLDWARARADSIIWCKMVLLFIF